MYEEFLKIINELYKIIKEPIDIMYIMAAINKAKTALNIGSKESFGNYYYKFIEKDKSTGVVYTDEYLAKYIVENVITGEDYIKNPFLKIMDPSCGCGNLIIFCYKFIKNIFNDNLQIINEKNNLNLKPEDIDNHILKNNLFGADIDLVAVKILCIDLFSYSHCTYTKNFFHGDFLLDYADTGVDIFIGNPPYVGQKSIDKSYSKRIKEKYPDIFEDKGDLSYCFYKCAIDKLKDGGRLAFISSRYFIEAQSGASLRKLLSKFKIYKILDFYGIRPFKSVGIDPIIIFIEKEKKPGLIEVIKPLSCAKGYKNKFYNSVFLDEGREYKKFYLNGENLNSRWILKDSLETGIIKKIDDKCSMTLGDACEVYQGIITGCDKAFIGDSKTFKDDNIEIDLIKPWIKNSHISKNSITRRDSYIIYSNLIKDIEEYPNAINHISLFKDKLMERRECRNGKRKWYELQWGRISSIFEGEKIVFPYKSNRNRFALDKGSYFSADVYAMVLKDEKNFDYNFLLFILNTKLYEFYIKATAKKLGDDLYEYYPNNLVRLSIPMKHCINSLDEENLYSYFSLNTSEIKLIEDEIRSND